MQTFREWLRENELNEAKSSSNSHITIYGEDIEQIFKDLNNNKSLMKIIEKLEKQQYSIKVWLWATDYQNFPVSLRKLKSFAGKYNDGDAI